MEGRQFVGYVADTNVHETSNRFKVFYDVSITNQHLGLTY